VDYRALDERGGAGEVLGLLREQRVPSYILDDDHEREAFIGLARRLRVIGGSPWG